jgi:hypothetical protein
MGGVDRRSVISMLASGTDVHKLPLLSPTRNAWEHRFIRNVLVSTLTNVHICCPPPCPHTPHRQLPGQQHVRHPANVHEVHPAPAQHLCGSLGALEAHTACTRPPLPGGGLAEAAAGGAAWGVPADLCCAAQVGVGFWRVRRELQGFVWHESEMPVFEGCEVAAVLCDRDCCTVQADS